MHKYILVLSAFIFCACSSKMISNPDLSQQENYFPKGTGAVKFINNCDFVCNAILPDTIMNAGKGRMVFTADKSEKIEGAGSFKYDYTLAHGASLYIKKTWYDLNRSDLSFHPLGISLWVKGSASNADRLSVILLQQNETFSLSNKSLKEFVYINDTVLSKAGWTKLVIPYAAFKNNHQLPVLELVAGIKLGVTNVSDSRQARAFYLDDIKQLTSYKPIINNKAKFSSIFIQLHPQSHERYNWKKDFTAYKDVGIDTVIVQYATSHSDNRIFNYTGSKFNRGVIKEYSMIDDIFSVAENVGLKVILGLNGGKYPADKGNVFAYDTLFQKHRVVIDDLYEKFSESSAMAGWYINEEFHDGQNKGWWKMQDRMLLAQYLQKVAFYAKSKPKKFMVSIAPALWRGRTAAMTGDFYKSILAVTKDIDVMYLQDCGGRCYVEQEDFDVYLPQYFEQIKKACDETGVTFGVDIESFKRCPCEGRNRRAKKWWELKEQLDMAGLFTTAITQFSWATFRPGIGAFDDYVKYVKRGI